MRINGKERYAFFLPKCALVLLFLNYANAMEFNYCQISPSHTLCQYAVSNLQKKLLTLMSSKYNKVN